jgi:mycoredoxin
VGDLTLGPGEALAGPEALCRVIAGRMHPVVPVVVERSRSVSSSPQDSTVSIVSTVTMYSTVWCGYCRRLKDQMDREGITFEVVDIEHDAAAAELVMSVNGGNQTVPTLVFPDGSALTNPSIKDVKAKLAA